MDSTKYIGMDVHKEAISIAVLNSSGKLVMESIIETKAITILQFIQGLRGSLHLTFEEGTWAAWLYDLLKPHVREIVVCNPRRNAYLKEGSKSDRIDARKLAELLRSNLLRTLQAVRGIHYRIAQDPGEIKVRLRRQLRPKRTRLGAISTKVVNLFE
jgi:Transposase